MSSLMMHISESGMLDLAVKSAAVMLLALIAAVLLARTSAARRHLVWCISVASLLLLPALSLALPACRVTWLPQWTSEPIPPTVTVQNTFVRADHVEPIKTERPTAMDAPPSVTPVASEVRSMPSVDTAETTISWLKMAWVAVGLLSLVPLAVGLWQLAALRRRSRVIDDQRWLSLLSTLRIQLSVRRGVQLRQSAATLMPLTWGALRPVLLVPDEANSWSEDRRRLVLLHELAHIRRWDWLTQLMAHVACALYWFNPLVWLAARQMRIERERACDDLVLASGVRGSDYAQELLSLATGLSDTRLSTLVAVPMARRGALEDRLCHILDSRCNRAALTTMAVCLGAVIAAAAIAPLAMLRAAPSKPTPPTAEEPKFEPPMTDTPELQEIASVNAKAAELLADKPAQKESTEKSTEKPAEKPAAKTTTIRGRVLDDVTGEPVGKIVIQGGKFESGDPKKVTWGYSEGRSSSPDGSFSTTVRWGDGWTARVVADGFIPQPVISSAPPADKDTIEVVIRLKRGPKVRGVVIDHTGKPVKNAAVFAIGPGSLNLAAGRSREGEHQSAQTDAEGRFELQIGEAKSVAVSHAAFDAWPAAISAEGEVTIRLPKPVRIDVNLAIDGAGNESEIFLQLLTGGRTEFAGLRLEREINMANPGKLSLDALPPGRYQLCRSVMNHLGEIGVGAFLEREFFELKEGETKTIHFVRDKGAKVRGKVTWPADTKLMGTVVAVRSEKAEKSPFDDHEWTKAYASTTTSADGTFQTERIAPGKYLIVASAYIPLTPEQRFRTGAILPSFRAEIKIEVPEDGELKVDDLVLKPSSVDE